MRYFGAILVLAGLGIAVGYLFYFAFGPFYDDVPTAIKIAVISIGLGLIMLLISIGRRHHAIKKGDSKKLDYWSQ